MIILSNFAYAQKDTLNYTKDEMNALFAKIDSLLHQEALLDSLQALRGEIASAISDQLLKADSTIYATQSDLTTGLGTKQATLVSGTNIKTVNSNSLLGSGNITISSDTSGLWAIVNGLVDDALSESDTLIGTSATLDSLILAFWNDQLGGAVPDSVVYAQELTNALVSKLNIADSSDYATAYQLSLKLAASTYNTFKSTLAGGTTDQALTKVDATDYNWNWSTISGGVSADTIPNQFTFTDVTDAALGSYQTAYIVVAGCDSARFYPASGDTIRSGALGAKTVSPIWIDNGDTLYTFCVASGSNSTTTRSIVYAANGTPVDTFSITTVAGGGGSYFFESGFESGTVGSIFDANYIEANNTIQIVSDTVYAGSNSLKFTSNPGSGTADMWVTIALPSATKVYIRFYIRYNHFTDYDGTAWQALYYLGLWDTDLTSDPIAYAGFVTDGSANLNGLKIRAEGTGAGEMGFTATPYTWEMHELGYNKSAGTLTYKIDGDSVAGVSGFTSVWVIDSVKFGVQFNVAADTNDYFYIDDVAIDTTDWVGP